MPIHRYLHRGFNRLSLKSFTFLLLLTTTSAIVVYFASPLRDPTFHERPFALAQTNSLIWWLKVLFLENVKEEHWFWGTLGLAGLLAINFMLLLWQYCRSQCVLAGNWHQKNNKVALFITLTVLCIGIWLLLCYVFVGYLLAQWVID
jgi:hypothetical protein